jgi:predicted amidohydrolase
MLIYSANWPAPRADVWRKLLMARAIENQCYVVGINRTGKDENSMEYSGNSMIIDFKGNIISEATNEEEVIYVSEHQPTNEEVKAFLTKIALDFLKNKGL